MTLPNLHFPGMTTLQGPYTVDYTDIPHDGNSKQLWTPQIGDIIVALFSDPATIVPGDNAGGQGFYPGGLQLGTSVTPTELTGVNNVDFSAFIYIQFNNTLGFISQPLLIPYIIRSTSPLQIRFDAGGGGDMTAGHMDLYALISRSPLP